MNTGIWFVLEVVFDTLMFAPYVLRGQFSARVKTTILFTYLALERQAAVGQPVPADHNREGLGFYGALFRLSDHAPVVQGYPPAQ